MQSVFQIFDTENKADFDSMAILQEKPVLVDILGFRHYFFFPVSGGAFVPYEIVFSAWIKRGKVYFDPSMLPEGCRKYFARYDLTDEISAMIHEMEVEDFAKEKAARIWLTF